MVTRRPYNAVRGCRIAGGEIVDRAEHRPGGQQGGFETRLVHGGVGVDSTTACLVYRPYRLEQFGIMNPRQLVEGGLAWHYPPDRIVDTGLGDPIESRHQSIGAFGMIPAGQMVDTSFVSYKQEHARTVPSPQHGVS